MFQLVETSTQTIIVNQSQFRALINLSGLCGLVPRLPTPVDTE